MLQPNWVEDVLDECEHVETPRSWLYWSLLCSIAAAAGNNYHLWAFKGAVKYKPNLYVILLGLSGLGKQFPVSLSKNLVDKAEITRVIYGRSSIQAIVRDLSQTIKLEGKELILDSRGFIVNGELSTAIIQDPDSLTILTDLYDPHDVWTNKLKGDGNEKLINPCVTALFGSSPAHFYDSIPVVNIEGGYIGRNLVVYEEKRYKDQDMFGEDDEKLEGFPYDKFVPHLQEINKHSGRIIPDSASKLMLNAWRRQWRKDQPDDKTGFVSRVPDHIVKVAMCLCLADYATCKSLVINEEHMTEAIEKVVELVYSSKRASAGIGVDPLAQQTKMVLDFLLIAPDNQLTRKKLLTKGYGNYDASILDRVLDTLDEMRWIIRIKQPAGRNSDVLIKLHGEPLEQYKKFVASRKNIKVVIK